MTEGTRASPRLSRGKVALAAALAAGVAAGALAWWWAHPPDPARAFPARHAPLAAVERAALEGRLERWTLRDDEGRVTSAMWRPAPAAVADPWTIVLLGGLVTGDRTALLVPERAPVNILALDWPWEGPRRMSRLTFLASVPRIRESLLRSPHVLALGVEAARRERGGRVALMGVSLGVPPAVAALRIVPADALLLADGGADFRTQLTRDAARALPRPLGATPLAPLAGALGARLLEPLDPARHGAAAADTPVLLVEALGDARIPARCRERLRAAFPHATVLRHERAHVRRDLGPALAAIAADAEAWLATVAPR